MSVIDLDGIHQKLLDINGDYHYFESEISVNLKPTDTILCGIVSQDDLDNGNMNLDEVTTGEYYMKISNNDTKQPYQNYFLCLKSTVPVLGITVNITTQELVEQIIDMPLPASIPITTNNNVFYVKLILTLIVLVIGITLMKKFWKQNKGARN